MPDESVESPEVREALNETLKDVLCNDGWGKSHWDGLVKYLREEFDIETDLVGLVRRGPCLFEMLELGALAGKGVVTKETQETVREIIHQLVRIAFRADNEGDEKAVSQLKAIHKLAHPVNYELPATVIKNLAESYIVSPHLARAWGIRKIMIDLSFFVKPTKKDRSVLQGPVELSTDPKARSFHPRRYDVAVRHIKRNSTLQSLAISIYMEELSKEGISIEPRQLKNDLKKLKEWEAVHYTDPSDRIALWSDIGYPRASVPLIPIYREDWKLRWRRGDKK